MKGPVLLIHVPVIHRGYLDLFRRLAPEVREVYIIGDGFVGHLRFLEADISALAPADARNLTAALGFFDSADVLEPSGLEAIRGREIVMISDELSRRLATQYLPGANVRWESVFLRWDESHVQRAATVKCDRESSDAFDRNTLALAYAEAAKSGDWWRQVGAVLVQGGKVLARANNRDMPDDQSSYRWGNIRDYLKPGERPEVSNTLHAESRIIAEAARAGMPLAGAHLYVTHFPCPMCAKAIAVSGIAKCFFGEGSATFDAEPILRAAGIEMISVPRDGSHG